MTAKEVQASGLRGRVRVIQEKGRSGSVEVLADMLAVLVLTE